MKLDFSEVRESKLVGIGRQTLTIKKAEEKKSLNGTNMLVVDFNDTEEGFVRDYIVLEGVGAFKAQNFFGALGIDLDEAGEMAPADLLGLSVDAEITHQEYEGEQRANIKKYYA